MNAIHKSLVIVLFLALFLSACGPNPEQLASTSAAQTQAAASPTPLPTNTPLPTDTSTPTLVPTDTPVPTNTPLPTATKPPTNTPTITPTPGPFSFFDDFSEDTGGWQDCEGCEWKDGALVMGPYDPSSFFHSNFCTACEGHKFYRMAVDVTFIDGQVDRFFGIVFADGKDTSYYLGISPWGFYYIARWHWDGEYWERIALQQSSAVVGSYGTNHIEVVVQPATSLDKTDYYIYLNGKLIHVIYTLPVEETWVGLAMDYHAQVASYDNWEYVVLEP